jgi:hypothetical protein
MHGITGAVEESQGGLTEQTDFDILMLSCNPLQLQHNFRYKVSVEHVACLYLPQVALSNQVLDTVAAAALSAGGSGLGPSSLRGSPVGTLSPAVLAPFNCTYAGTCTCPVDVNVCGVCMEYF